MIDTLAGRMKLMIDARADRRGKFAQLQELTGIPAENWKSFYYDRQRPNPDMIETICQAWPEHALWLTTGITDSAHGQIGIADAYQSEINLVEKPEQIASMRYIKRKAEIFKKMTEESRTTITKDELSEIYELRCARDTERLGYLTRRAQTSEGGIKGYFDSRLLRHTSFNENMDGPEDDGNKQS
ncbi:hypothetical protein V3C40_07200 [Janthinobacterium sp. LS2A]|uniref:hypothetical protein n=1 Tax=Janthinobacterium sp. LS2A TaxID=3118590 RepID=UPI002F928A3F